MINSESYDKSGQKKGSKDSIVWGDEGRHQHLDNGDLDASAHCLKEKNSYIRAKKEKNKKER